MRRNGGGEAGAARGAPHPEQQAVQLAHAEVGGLEVVVDGKKGVVEGLELAAKRLHPLAQVFALVRLELGGLSKPADGPGLAVVDEDGPGEAHVGVLSAVAGVRCPALRKTRIVVGLIVCATNGTVEGCKHGGGEAGTRRGTPAAVGAAESVG